MTKGILMPDYILESSWEVCNKVGGIYTVLSTRAKTLQDLMKDRIVFIGPDCWGEKECPYFNEDKSLFAEWKDEAMKDTQIIRQFIADNNTQEVLALVEELGLSLLSVTHENTIS